MYVVKFGNDSSLSFSVACWTELGEAMIAAHKISPEASDVPGYIACPANLDPFCWAQIPGLVLDSSRLDTVSMRRNWNKLLACASQIGFISSLYPPERRPSKSMALVLQFKKEI